MFLVPSKSMLFVLLDSFWCAWGKRKLFRWNVLDGVRVGEQRGGEMKNRIKDREYLLRKCMETQMPHQNNKTKDNTHIKYSKKLWCLFPSHKTFTVRICFDILLHYLYFMEYTVCDMNGILFSYQNKKRWGAFECHVIRCAQSNDLRNLYSRNEHVWWCLSLKYFLISIVRKE